MKKKDIEKWLDNHDIMNYSLSENLHVKVFGNVNLIKSLEFKCGNSFIFS